ncbi:class I SAM-dependent methyltransferase [Carboxylicivirga sp. N1Y90]|uniref:class I SAM-dependent methyltransferase n=1 Tax=Carboxylicivirga fragile TaxID=3417571 RepID=UPI003D333131|nr:class I SAM-dependent methyltransferase [Marinilabiliaceae bacterium N1Y90]
MMNQEILEKIIDAKLSNYFTQFEALYSIKKMFPEAVYLPPTRGWAGSPDFLLKLIELVITESPKYVLELGSGVSSIILGLALNRFTNGQLVSVDHEADFAQKTRKFIDVNKLNGTVEVNHCPLCEYQYNESSWKWYDLSKIKLENKIDLLVVDGPPRKIQMKSRFPALPVLREKLSLEATIVLDDANRLNEQQVIKDWESYLIENDLQFDLFDYPDYEKGMAVIKLHT